MAVSRTLVLIYFSAFIICFANGFGSLWRVHKHIRVPHSLAIGDTVERGSDWEWREQDVGKLGIVISELCPEKWIAVRWLDNSENEYRHGNNSKYDIKKVTRSLHFNTEKELVQAKKDWGNLGRSVPPSTIPYLVELRMSGNRKEVCGGSIVNSRWIVTAASCVTRRSGSMKVVVAYTGISEEYDVEEVIIHPGWNSSGRDFGFGNDIALVKVRQVFRKTKLPLLSNADISASEERHAAKISAPSVHGIER